MPDTDLTTIANELVAEPSTEATETSTNDGFDLASIVNDALKQISAEQAPAEQTTEAAPTEAIATEEQVPSVEPEQPTKDEKTAVDTDKWRELIRLDAENRRLRQEAKQASELKSQLEALKTNAVKFEVKTPMQIAKESGLTLDQVLDAMVSEQEQTPAVEEILNPIAAKLAALEQKLIEKERLEQQQAISSVEDAQLNTIYNLAQTNPDAFELTLSKGLEGLDLTLEVAAVLADQHQIEINPTNLQALYASALEAVEAHFEAEQAAALERARSTKKLSRYFAPAQEPKASPIASQAATASSSKTLGATVASTPVPNDANTMSDDDVIQEALRLFRS